MFRQKVCQTMMTSEAANNFFQHITGNDWNGDVSFVSTLRALTCTIINSPLTHLIFG